MEPVSTPAPVDPVKARASRLTEHDIETSPSGRTYTRKEYIVRVIDEDGNVREKTVKLDVTRQSKPLGDTQPAPLPTFEEELKKAEEHFNQEGGDAFGAALALQAMRQTPTEEQPEPSGVEVLSTPGNSVPVGEVVPSNLTREAALKLLASYVGGALDGENLLDDDGVRVFLADNLGTLVSSLDGTEEFAARVNQSATHPRFYFREGLRRARTYLNKAKDLIDDFPWVYSQAPCGGPSVAVTDLRKAQGYIGYAVAAITGRGAETPPRRDGGDRYNEDGLVPYNAPGARAIGSLEQLIATSERVLAALKKLKEKRDGGTLKDLQRAKDELHSVVAKESTQILARGAVSEDALRLPLGNDADDQEVVADENPGPQAD